MSPSITRVKQSLSMRNFYVIINRILNACRKPVLFAGKSYQLSVSIGTAISKGNNFDEHQLLKQADQAMYAAKRKGGDCAANEDDF